MPTNERGSTALQLDCQVTHALKKTVKFSDGVVEIGTVPAGAVIKKAASVVSVLTAFDAGTTNTLHIGTEADNDLYATALALGTVAEVPLDEFSAANRPAVATKLIATYNNTGTAPTAGEAEVIIEYVVNGS